MVAFNFRDPSIWVATRSLRSAGLEKILPGILQEQLALGFLKHLPESRLTNRLAPHSPRPQGPLLQAAGGCQTPARGQKRAEAPERLRFAVLSLWSKGNI